MSEEPAKTGRPTKLTPEVQAEIVGSIEAGAHYETACEAAGIDPSTYRAWMRWGTEGNQKEPYRSFAREVTRARAQAELDLLKTAKSGDDAGTSNGPAKCAQWVLERTRGSRYAPRVTVKVQEALEMLLDDVERVCASKDCGCLESLLERLARRASGEEVGEDPGGAAGEE